MPGVKKWETNSRKVGWPTQSITRAMGSGHGIACALCFQGTGRWRRFRCDGARHSASAVRHVTFTEMALTRRGEAGAGGRR